MVGMVTFGVTWEHAVEAIENTGLKHRVQLEKEELSLQR